MNPNCFSTLSALSAFALVGTMLLSSAPSAVSAEVEQDYEVLTRGPVHEAFAASVSFDPEPGLIVRTGPPELIEELPPEHQLEGDNVAWIPGYWAWDDDQDDFLWVSGIWRNLPPGRQWVPGYWNEIDGGQFQWTSGYWADSTSPEISYIPSPPPRSLEVGSNISASSDDECWIPGNWAWGESRYAWRPGYWAPLRPDWTWVPSHYSWTRRGYIYVDGYWDHAVGSRGVLFAPVHFNRHVYASPGYFYTPSIVVGLNVFVDHLFVRPRCGHYYFGDYYAPRYRDAGFHASFSWHSGRRGYDPIYAHERWNHRNEGGWERRRHTNFNYFRGHEEARPSHTYAAMRNSREDRFNDGRSRSFATPLDSIARNRVEGQRFRVLDNDRRSQFVSQRQELRTFGQGRRQLETRGLVAGDASGKIAVRERLARSPIIGRQADRFSKQEAPPARPEVRGNNLRPNPAGPARPQPGTARRDGAPTPGERREAATRPGGAGGAAGRNLEPRSNGDATYPAANQERAGKQAARPSPGRPFPAQQGDAVSETPLRQAARPIPDHRTEGTPQRRPPSNPQQVREAPQRAIQAAPPRQSRPAPQARPLSERRPEGTPQRQAPSNPQQVREASQRRIQAASQRHSAAKAQARSAPQRMAQGIPQRPNRPRPQVREAPPRKPQVATQRHSPPQPQARPAPQLRAHAAPQRQAHPRPQDRSVPNSRSGQNRRASAEDSQESRGKRSKH